MSRHPTPEELQAAATDGMRLFKESIKIKCDDARFLRELAAAIIMKENAPRWWEEMVPYLVFDKAWIYIEDSNRGTDRGRWFINFGARSTKESIDSVLSDYSSPEGNVRGHVHFQWSMGNILQEGFNSETGLRADFESCINEMVATHCTAVDAIAIGRPQAIKDMDDPFYGIITAGNPYLQAAGRIAELSNTSTSRALPLAPDL